MVVEFGTKIFLKIAYPLIKFNWKRDDGMVSALVQATVLEFKPQSVALN